MDRRERLENARAMLRSAENAMGVRCRHDISETRGLAFPVMHVRTYELMPTVVDLLPERGWVGMIATANVRWEAAARAGLDLERVLVVRTREYAGYVCSLMLEGIDVVCLGAVDLTHQQRRRLAAQTRSQGRHILTLEPWDGISRSRHEASSLITASKRQAS
ncbi:hypothetical protein [Schaalia vaccimaxillae]|uniref:hypothetical protein n=1 Tax=Schaalia vaccimaxillae TaxID=183916 RepID=UPI0003B79CFA|nr:hypothetical protein [Schaalia vaccimaxillae]